MKNLNTLLTEIKQCASGISNKVAVFDADGTLWKEDVGFGFFQFQLKKGWLKDNCSVNKLNHIYKSHQAAACSLIVQMNQGVPLEQYQVWCRQYLQTNPLTVFSFQRKILSLLKTCGATIYVVSASPQWAVEAALKHYQLEEVDQVIGVKTQIQDGKITDQIYQPLPVGDGKWTAFLEHSQTPFFVSGNTLSDLSLLEASSHIRFVVASAGPQDRQYEKEQKLLELARQKSWFFYHSQT